MLACLLVGIVVTIASHANAQDATDAEAWLVTYGPGEIYWQRFGHNAIWIRDHEVGLDHVFNYGFFDFEQEGFLLNFLEGRLEYFAAARPAQVEFAEYIDENRSIRAQRLSLDSDQIDQLAGSLLTSVSPENRDYLYDYYRNNCSTRVRDALDQAYGALISESLDVQASPLNYRDHTRRLTEMDFWLYLGLEAGLASPVDAPISRWDELFIPGALAEALADLHHPDTGLEVVLEDVVLHESTFAPPPDQPHPVWYRYLVIPLVLVIVAGLAVRIVPGLTLRHLAVGWFCLTAVLGAVLLYLWLFTDHWVARLNLNLLLLNPVWALVPILKRPGPWLVVIAGLISPIMFWLPPFQYNLDVIAAVLPVNLVAAIVLLRRESVSEVGH